MASRIALRSIQLSREDFGRENSGHEMRASLSMGSSQRRQRYRYHRETYFTDSVDELFVDMSSAADSHGVPKNALEDSFFSIDMDDGERSDIAVELPPPVLKPANIREDDDAEKPDEREIRREELRKFSNRIAREVHKLLLDVKTRVVEEMWLHVLDGVEEVVMSWYTEVEEQLKLQTSFRQMLDKLQSGRDCM